MTLDNQYETEGKQPDEAEVKRLIEERIQSTASRGASTSTAPNFSNNGNGDQTRPWQTLIPFHSKLPATSYPIEALPTIIREAICEVQEYTQAPIALVANSALVSLATVCQAHFDVARDDNLKSP